MWIGKKQDLVPEKGKGGAKKSASARCSRNSPWLAGAAGGEGVGKSDENLDPGKRNACVAILYSSNAKRLHPPDGPSIGEKGGTAIRREKVDVKNGDGEMGVVEYPSVIGQRERAKEKDRSRSEKNPRTKRQSPSEPYGRKRPIC